MQKKKQVVASDSESEVSVKAKKPAAKKAAAAVSRLHSSSISL